MAGFLFARYPCRTEGPAMLEHFTKVHNPSNMKIKGIQVGIESELTKLESEWRMKLGMAFPYSLNDRISTAGIQDSYSHIMENTSLNKPVYDIFDKIPSKRTKRGGRNSQNLVAVNNSIPFSFSVIDFMENDIMNINCGDFSTMEVRTKVMALNKAHTKELFIHLSHCIYMKDRSFGVYSSCKFNEFLPYVVRDLCLSKLKKMVILTKKVNQNYLVIDYGNKLMDNIYLSSILKRDTVSNLFPVNDEDIKIPNISYKYPPTIRFNITNYKKTVQDGIIPDTCVCNMEKYQGFLDPHHGHVFTGNLNFIDNIALRNLIQKGLNFRETPAPNKLLTIKNITSALDSYITNISEKTNTNIALFNNWKKKILSLVDSKLQRLQPYKFNNVLTQEINKKDLQLLHNDFVFIPTDKASNNVSVVCKTYYLEHLSSELNNTNTFELSNQSRNSIINEHKGFMESLGLKANLKIPYMYWTAKMHKTPVSTRFITSGIGSTLEPLSKLVCTALVTLVKIKKNNAAFYHNKTGFNKYFIVDNRYPLTKFMDKDNGTDNIKTIKTYDFEALYTNIPQQKLKDAMHLFVKSIFKMKNKEFISISGVNSWLTRTKSKKVASFSCNQFIDCIFYLIENSYVLFKDALYKQVIGIPMGISCGPQLANIFLHVYEEYHIDRLLENRHVNLAGDLSNIFRYQDDCAVLNDNGTFDFLYRTIYPNEMVLKGTNISSGCTNYLDLNINVIENKFVYKSYDKRNDFPFQVINYPDIKGNLPVAPTYGIFTSQLIRFCEINNHVETFKQDVDLLVKKLLHQNFDMAILKNKYNQFCRDKIEDWAKFGVDISNFV